MDSSENPYLAPIAELPRSFRPPAPALLKLAVSLYLLCYLIALFLVLSQGFRAPLLSSIAWLLIGIFTVGIGIGLLRANRWARWWVAALTALAVISFASNLPWPTGTLHGDLGLLRVVMRIVVGCLLFAPSVRSWFA
jgi:hypothetical protein